MVKIFIFYPRNLVLCFGVVLNGVPTHECPEWYSNPRFQCSSYRKHCVDMLVALRVQEACGANEFAECRMWQVTVESGPVIWLTRMNMDKASMSCHPDDGQLQQNTLRLYHPRSLARRKTEGHALMWPFYCPAVIASICTPAVTLGHYFLPLPLFMWL